MVVAAVTGIHLGKIACIYTALLPNTFRYSHNRRRIFITYQWIAIYIYVHAYIVLCFLRVGVFVCLSRVAMQLSFICIVAICAQICMYVCACVFGWLILSIIRSLLRLFPFSPILSFLISQFYFFFVYRL